MSEQQEERLQLFVQMKRKRVKQKDLAKRLSVSCSAISQYLSGKDSMSEEKIQQLKDIIASA